MSDCAEFWARYIRFLEPKNLSAAQHAMQRAQGTHCKSQPEMQLLAARFHERHRDIVAARVAYQVLLERLAPGLVGGVLACANFERRQVCFLCACISLHLQTLDRASLFDPFFQGDMRAWVRI